MTLVTQYLCSGCKETSHGFTEHNGRRRVSVSKGVLSNEQQLMRGTFLQDINHSSLVTILVLPRNQKVSYIEPGSCNSKCVRREVSCSLLSSTSLHSIISTVKFSLFIVLMSVRFMLLLLMRIHYFVNYVTFSIETLYIDAHNEIRKSEV